MKNLDIENLERKNIYRTPESFFDDVQAKVLQETLPQKQVGMKKSNWAYGMAAAVAMIFGVTFFVNQKEGSDRTDAQASNTGNAAVNNSISEIKPKKEAAVAYQTLQNDLTSTAQDNQKEDEGQLAVVGKQSAGTQVQKNSAPAQISEVQVDQMLSNFTSAELADLGKNTEQDIYLDLYN